MEQILNKLEEYKNWKDILRASCKNNGISTSLTGQLTVLKTRSLYKRFQKTYQKQNDKLKYYWGQNQLKTFHWILICVSAIYNIKVTQFTYKQWNLMQFIFKGKQMSVLQYQATKLLNSKVKKTKPWNKNQDQLLLKIIQLQGQNNKWNQIGKGLFWESNTQYFRTGKQCRERWLNHLDPKKKHGCWTNEEDLKLLQLADQQNRKWAKIVKAFHGERTQHMIKNRFKSLISKQRKLTPNLKKEDRIIQFLKVNLKSNSNLSFQQKQKIEEQQFNINNDDNDDNEQQNQNQEDQNDSQSKQLSMQAQFSQQQFNKNNNNNNINKLTDDKVKVQQKCSPIRTKCPIIHQNKGFQYINTNNNNHNTIIDDDIMQRDDNYNNRNNVQSNNNNNNRFLNASPLDPIIESCYEQLQNKNTHFSSGYKMLSPYCLYSMNNNLTPTGLTPTLFSPNAFYMNSFAQSVIVFQQCLNNSDGSTQSYDNKKN